MDSVWTAFGSESYLRFQSATPNRHGHHPGVFALVNGLSRSGVLTAAQEQFRRRENAWYQRNLRDPATIDPAIYDRNRHPGAAAWFKLSARQMIARVTGYIEILDHHSICWMCLCCADPGRIVYEDQHQIVVVAKPYPAPPPGVQ